MNWGYEKQKLIEDKWVTIDAEAGINLITNVIEKKKIRQNYIEEYKRLTGMDLMCSEVPRKRSIGKYKKSARKYIVDITAEYFEVPKEDIVGESKKSYLTKARQYIAYLLNQMSINHSETARILQYKDHTSIIHSIKVIKDELSVNKDVEAEYKEYKEHVLAELEKRFRKQNQLTKDQIEAIIYTLTNNKEQITHKELGEIYQVSGQTITSLWYKHNKKLKENENRKSNLGNRQHTQYNVE